MNQEELLKKKALEKEAYDHYYNVIDKMIKWCVCEQPEEIEVMFSAFGINKKDMTLKACKDVLKKWEKASEGIQKRDK